MDKTPVYKYPASYARENDELELYRASSKANVACKEAIEQAIAAHYFDNILHHGAVKEVVDQFGYERTLYVLANTVRQKDWDGRISNDNKAWAQTIPVFENPDAWGNDRNCAFVVDRPHTGLTDLFINQARHEYLLTQPLTKQEIHMEAGDVCVHPGGVVHGGKTLTGMKSIDIFSPPRTDKGGHVERMQKYGTMPDEHFEYPANKIKAAVDTWYKGVFGSKK